MKDLFGYVKVETPKQKLLESGRWSLSDSELIAIFFQKDKIEGANSLLREVQYNLNEIGRMSVPELVGCGVNEAAAVYLVAAIELGNRRRQSEDFPYGTQIKGSKDAASYIRTAIEDLAHEEFHVIFLNRQNKILCSKKLSQGGITGTVIDVRLVLKCALEKRATSMILAHNHPSGNLEPSDADKKITRQLKEGAALMEVPVIDHLIISSSGYFSFADEGLL